MQFPVTRMRRLRKNSKIRDIVRETKLQKEDLIYPIYFKQDLEGDEKEEISSLPGEFRYSLKSGVEFAKKLESKRTGTVSVRSLDSGFNWPQFESQLYCLVIV